MTYWGVLRGHWFLYNLSLFCYVLYRAFLKKVAKSREDKQRSQLKRCADAAITIQKLARGVLSRAEFKKNLATLKQSLRQRQFCIECENNVAQKRCRQCKDRFCNNCYKRIHAKGARRSHTFDTIRMDEQTLSKIQTVDPGRAQIAAGTSVGAVKALKKDWEEFYDASAKAKYWFNKSTGEALWVSPF